MSLRWAGLATAALLFASSAAEGQVIQLPTFRSTTVNTTVSVPVSGAGFAGGTNYARTEGLRRGIPELVGKGFPEEDLVAGRASSGVEVRATLIDHERMDAAVRAGSTTKNAGEDVLVLRKASRISQSIDRSDSKAAEKASKAPLLSLEQIRRQNRFADQQSQQEISALLNKAESAEAAGKKSIAVIYYRMAARRAAGDMQQHALAKLADLAKPRGAKIAKTRP